MGCAYQRSIQTSTAHQRVVSQWFAPQSIGTTWGLILSHTSASQHRTPPRLWPCNDRGNDAANPGYKGGRDGFWPGIG